MNQCKFIKINDEQCKTAPIKGEEFCFFHSEKYKAKRKEAVMKGGNSLKRNYGSSEEIKLENANDILKLIEKTADELRANKMNTKMANAVNLLANTAIKAIELRYYEDGKKLSPLQEKFQKEFLELNGIKVK